ncbi:MAG: hypothetical protein BGN88_01660 [Clostridiales bacterium 43-6]|nr:MAG: hypothetical protein BGN88_01660 [Clostridiales bacterium 43-6]
MMTSKRIKSGGFSEKAISSAFSPLIAARTLYSARKSSARMLKNQPRYHRKRKLVAGKCIACFLTHSCKIMRLSRA